MGSNGYVAAGYVGGTAGGGSIHPQPGSTSTPTVFPGSTSVSGFWIDALGRLGPSYLASLQYENYKASGGDRPLVSYEQLAGVYQAPLSPWGFGVSLMSAQRSTVNANMNGVGVGFELMPNLGRPLSFFSSGFFYPHVASLGASSSFFIGDLGLHIAPAKRGGFFVRVGVSTHCCWPASTSPRSDTGPTIGVGTTF